MSKEAKLFDKNNFASLKNIQKNYSISVKISLFI